LGKATGSVIPFTPIALLGNLVPVDFTLNSLKVTRSMEKIHFVFDFVLC
jgi:hypothetical protein